MEIVFWSQSPAYPRIRPTLLVRPVVGVPIGGSGVTQPFLRNNKYSRTRTIQCIVANSDFPNRKLIKKTTTKIKVTAFGGDAPRLMVEPSAKTREHHDSDEEMMGTNNKLLNTDPQEWGNSRKIESSEVHSSQNASTNSTLQGVDATEEEEVLDIIKDDLPENVLDNKSIEKLDNDEDEEDKLQEVIVVDEAKAKKDIFVFGLLGIAPNLDTRMDVVEVINETGLEHDIVEVDSLEISSSKATPAEVDFMGESGFIYEAFDDDFSYNSARSKIYGEVVVTGETQIKEIIFEKYLSVLSSSNARIGGMDVVYEASTEKNTLGTMSLLGGDPDTTKYMVVDSVDETRAEEVNCQQQYTSLSERSMQVHNQNHGATAFDVRNSSIVRFPKQDLAIAHLPEKNCYMVQSIISMCKQDQSIVGYYRQDASIVRVPKQTQSLLGFNKPHQFIVCSRNDHKSIVCFPAQKRSIVAFQKPDLSIVATSIELQTKHVTIVSIDDIWHGKGMEANKLQKPDRDTHTIKVDVDRLLQKGKEDIIEEGGDMTTSKKVDEEHILTTEAQMITSLGEEQPLVMEERILAAKKMDEDELMHLLSEEVGIIEGEEQSKVHQTYVSVEKDKLEFEVDIDPQTRQRILQELAEKNHSLGNMLFLYPGVVKADSTINILLNRDLSALVNEPDVIIKGAFNGWRWKPFTERLHKSEFGGDWWCCKLYIPKQAYRLDFVFFNGRTVYENNENNDFVWQIESDMDEHLFEGFLVKEKKMELERLATEEAERRRHRDDQQRREEERVVDEAVRAQAKAEIGIKKNKLRMVLDLAKISVDNLWYIDPIRTGQESKVRIYYNRSLRSLAHSAEIWIHGGYNNWIDGLSFAEKLDQHDGENTEWWFAEVVLPDRAYVLDWVFANGPPGSAQNFDNNDKQDFHAILPNNKTEVEYWKKEEQRIYTRLIQERREKEEAVKRKAQLNAKMKLEMKEKTMRMFLVSQKHIVYTEPLKIHAGTTVDVLYNPSSTVLNGKSEVWFRCSFNRWMYPGGVLPPQKMVQAENCSHLKAIVNVPTDAYVMDFVFSESEEGGIYDNRNGLDYHIPIFGSIGKESSMHIVHIAVEMAPIAKVGGLGDVVTSLSRAVQDLGHKVEVIVPKHDCLNLSRVRNLHVRECFPWGGTEIRVWSGLVEDVFVYFLEPQNGMFGVGCVYGRNDDRRFGFFCHSALEFLHQSGSSPHIIHCHDWSSAPVAWLCKENYAQSSLADARVIFTIHNLEFGAHYIGKAMKYCDKATTVSNTYSREISGHGAIAPHLGKFFGILNGIDPDIWDPYNDSFIPVHYTPENVVEGKSAAKKALQQKLGLQQTDDVPVVGIISRLTAQKGIHLIKHAIHRILERNGQVVLLGSAPDPGIQQDFCNLANTLHGVSHGRVRLCLTYDEPLSHLIYAGSDFILVPSIFEPCGLTQLVAMRYGSIPIVRKTGGLYDTIFDVEHDRDRARARGVEPNGFSFDGADATAVDYILNRAFSAWFEAREWFQSLSRRVMEQDWSWNRPALDYIELYRSAAARRF